MEKKRVVAAWQRKQKFLMHWQLESFNEVLKCCYELFFPNKMTQYGILNVLWRILVLIVTILFSFKVKFSEKCHTKILLSENYALFLVHDFLAFPLTYIFLLIATLGPNWEFQLWFKYWNFASWASNWHCLPIIYKSCW